MKHLADQSPEIPRVLWKDHPAPSLESSGWLWRVLSEAPGAVTTEVPPASQKSQAGAHHLISRTTKSPGNAPSHGLPFPGPQNASPHSPAGKQGHY